MKTRLNGLSVNCNVRECRSGNFEELLNHYTARNVTLRYEIPTITKLNMANYSTIDGSGKGKSATTINVNIL